MRCLDTVDVGLVGIGDFLVGFVLVGRGPCFLGSGGSSLAIERAFFMGGGFLVILFMLVALGLAWRVAGSFGFDSEVFL